MVIERVRIDPRRLEPGAYPFIAEIAPRFGDMDALRHLNNVALAEIYEEGRIAFHRAVRHENMREQGTRTVIGQVLIQYLREASYPEMLQVGVGVTRVGEASYTLSKGLFQKGRCVGVADTVIVNTRDHRACPLTPAFRQALLEMKLQFGDSDG
jgi:acyl-CoA thioester hydrolase